MADYSIKFYEGANYGLEPRESETSLSPFTGYQLPAGSFGFPSFSQSITFWR